MSWLIKGNIDTVWFLDLKRSWVRIPVIIIFNCKMTKESLFRISHFIWLLDCYCMLLVRISFHSWLQFGIRFTKNPYSSFRLFCSSLFDVLGAQFILSVISVFVILHPKSLGMDNFHSIKVLFLWINIFIAYFFENLCLNGWNISRN